MPKALALTFQESTFFQEKKRPCEGCRRHSPLLFWKMINNDQRSMINDHWWSTINDHWWSMINMMINDQWSSMINDQWSMINDDQWWSMINWQWSSMINDQWWSMVNDRIGLGWFQKNLMILSLFGHVGVTFSWNVGHVGRCLGILRGRFRMVLGWFREKVPNMLKNTSFQICPGVFFQSRAAQN